MSTNTNTADASTRSLTITRDFDAPRDLVWRAWTDPEEMKKWWGPENYTSPEIRIDLRVGGRYVNCMRSPEGEDYWSTGVYTEIVAPERLACTDSFADADGNPVPASHYGMGDDWPMETQVTVTFEEQGEGTRMTLRHDGLPAGTMSDMTEQGWNGSLDKLEKSLA